MARPVRLAVNPDTVDHIERFEEEEPESFEEATNAERVVRFLARHDDRAWKQAEIADGSGSLAGPSDPS